MARVMDVVPPARVFQVGMRTGDRSEYRRRVPHLYPAHAIRPVDAVRSLLPRLAAQPLYVTIDVDVLDPSEAPGTGAPEPCGLTTSELIEIIRLLEPCHVVGADLVEVAHAFDPSGRTGITASWILREAILTWWGK
jgi:agmatinase